MGKPCVEHVVTIMPQTNSGFAVTYVRDGSMASALRSHLLGLSTSSSTSAHPVLTREPVRDDCPGCSVCLSSNCIFMDAAEHVVGCNRSRVRKASVLSTMVASLVYLE